MQEQGSFVQKTLRRFHILDDDRACHTPQFGFFASAKLFSGVDNDWQLLETDLGLDPFDEFKATHIGQDEIQDHAVEALFSQRFKSLDAAADCAGHNVSVANQFNDAVTLDFIVFDHE